MKAILNPKILMADDNPLRLANETPGVLSATLMPNVAVVVASVVVAVFVVKTYCQELTRSRRAPGYFILIDDKTPPAARDCSEIARA